MKQKDKVFREDLHSKDITVAVPVHNGADLMPDLLDTLKAQTFSEEISWEILIVDNNSTDDLVQIIKRYQRDWRKAVQLRYVFEKRHSLAYAYERCVNEADSLIVGFLDADNRPFRDWVEKSYLFGVEHPEAVAWGSRVFPEYEISPPENFERIDRFLAINNRDDTLHEYKRRDFMLPAGAGLVVRKKAWQEHVPGDLKLREKKGPLSRGQDLEVLINIQKTGAVFYHNPKMKVCHYIPRLRLQKDYLYPFFRIQGLSRHYVRMLRYKAWQRPFMVLLHMGNDIRKIVLHILRYRKKIVTDLVTACELRLYFYSFFSPFYFLGTNIRRLFKPIDQ